jgi:EAL domain-containing protein (putative c-di-GMP-specific phosphodiesterase class I)
MVERVATELGFEVLGTGNPDSSMKIAGAWQPSAVVVGVGGVGGPGTDGIEALGRLAAAKCTAPIVLLGGIDRRKVEAARLFGAQRGLRIEAILEKPIGLHGLRDRLARLKPSAKPDLSTDLAAALPAGHLFLEYQPTYAVAGPAGGRTVGAEALVRWRHPVHGVIQPAEFLGLAEGAELIRLVTDWVFARAVEQAAAWGRDGIGLEVAVNITVPDLRNTRLPERLEELCRDAGVAPGSVVLELAEAGAMRYGAEVAAVLDRLRAKGFQLALDNFGSGWFSLVQLRKLPLSRLKLDRSLVIGLAADADLKAVAAIIVDLATKLGLKSVAQGVEDQATLDFLAAIGCDLAQGNHMSPAVAPERIAELARRR